MFQVNLDFLIRIAGCPESGIPAIDFRRANRLPDAPSNQVVIKWSGSGEALCRKFAEYTTESGDLNLVTARDYHSDSSVVAQGENATSYELKEALSASEGKSTLFGFRLPADLIRPFLDGTASADDVPAVIDLLLSQSREAKKQAADRQAEREQKEQAAKAERDRVQAETEASKKVGLESLAAWVRESGSELSKLRLEEGYDSWVSTAREDYADSVAEGVSKASGFAADDRSTYEAAEKVSESERKSPTAGEIKAMRKVRSACPAGVTCKLNWFVYSGGDLEEEIKRAEIELTIPVPGAGEEERYLLV